MPTYNKAPFLRRAVRSLLAQSFPHWELLIIDDGSSDEALSLIPEYQPDPRIRAWRLNENGGVARALNFAFTVARVPLLAYLPSDDMYYPDHLGLLFACSISHPDACLVYSGVRFHQKRIESVRRLAFRYSWYR